MVNLSVRTLNTSPSLCSRAIALLECWLLAALRRAREEKAKELNATVSVIEKLLSAINNAEKNLNGNIERKVGKPILTFAPSSSRLLPQGSGPSNHSLFPFPLFLPLILGFDQSEEALLG